MADKFQDKYRIPSARLSNWDYSSNSAYFITICAANPGFMIISSGTMMNFIVSGIIS